MIIPEGFQCEACGRFFLSPEDLRTHDASIHSPRIAPSYSCTDCGGSFDSIFDLDDHRTIVHSGS
jgi:hypothetical protein